MINSGNPCQALFSRGVSARKSLMVRSQTRFAKSRFAIMTLYWLKRRLHEVQIRSAGRARDLARSNRNAVCSAAAGWRSGSGDSNLITSFCGMAVQVQVLLWQRVVRVTRPYRFLSASSAMTGLFFLPLAASEATPQGEGE